MGTNIHDNYPYGQSWYVKAFEDAQQTNYIYDSGEDFFFGTWGIGEDHIDTLIINGSSTDWKVETQPDSGFTFVNPLNAWSTDQIMLGNVDFIEFSDKVIELDSFASSSHISFTDNDLSTPYNDNVILGEAKRDWHIYVYRGGSDKIAGLTEKKEGIVINADSDEFQVNQTSSGITFVNDTKSWSNDSLQLTNIDAIYFNDKSITLKANDPAKGKLDTDNDGFVDEATNYRMWTESGGVDLTNRRGKTFSDDTSRLWDLTKAIEVDSGFSILLEGDRLREDYYRVISARKNGQISGASRWMNERQMIRRGYDDHFDIDFNEIEIENITFTTHTYDIERIDFTSASSYIADLRVKAVEYFDSYNTTTTVKLQATKTATLSALAVARLFITKTAISHTLDPLSVKYDATDLGVRKGFGITRDGQTFTNGLGISAKNQTVTITNAPAIKGRGIGQAYAQATGYWNETQKAIGDFKILKGSINNIIAQTYTEFQKGDFSFLQLTATARVGISSTRKLVYDDVTNATIKNQWASYVKAKHTNVANLFTLDFGTRNFLRSTIGKAYMVITKGIENKVYKTETFIGNQFDATARATLALDNTFQAWHHTYMSGINITTTTSYPEWKKFWKQLSGIAKGTIEEIFASNGAGKVDYYMTGQSGLAEALADGFTRNQLRQGFFRLQTKDTLNAPLTHYEGRFQKANGNLIFNKAKADVINGLTTVPATLTRNQLYWSTIQRQNLATLTTTVRNTALAGLTYGLTTRQQNPGHNELNKNISQIIKPNNMNATKDDFATATGRLIMKIKVSDTDTASIYNFDSTIVRRTIIQSESLWLTNFPDFPEAGGVIDGFDLTYRHGDVVGDFDNVYLWNRALQNSIGITANGAPAVSKATGLSNALNRSIDNYANLGFFSGTEFNVNALAAQGFGSNAVREISAAQNLTNSSQVNANSVPFRILFFDNYATNNGLYIISGEADYAEGLLTAININGDHYGTLLPKSTISTTSSWGGKHTIVKVKGGKSDLIELSDINFI